MLLNHEKTDTLDNVESLSAQLNRIPIAHRYVCCTLRMLEHGKASSHLCYCR